MEYVLYLLFSDVFQGRLFPSRPLSLNSSQVLCSVNYGVCCRETYRNEGRVFSSASHGAAVAPRAPHGGGQGACRGGAGGAGGAGRDGAGEEGKRGHNVEKNGVVWWSPPADRILPI